ncbi:MAG: thiamine phosphate synthase [Polyangiaceae bacterium]
MRGLYALVDVGALGARQLEVLPFAEAVISARPAALQLRDKRGGGADTMALLRALRPLCQQAGVELFGNDRPDLAALAGCRGVHLGQEDVPVSMARGVAAHAMLDDFQVGLSTHDLAELDAGLETDADYLAIGPVFGTVNKERPAQTLGLDGLARLVARARAARPRLPLVAIGGIDASSAAAVARLVDAVAVIGALLPGDGAAPGPRPAGGRARTAALVSEVARGHHEASGASGAASAHCGGSSPPTGESA